MPFARIASTIRLTAAALFLGLMTIAAWAQEPPAGPVPQNGPETSPVPMLNYTKPVSHFPNPIAPYTPRHVAPPRPWPIPRASISPCVMANFIFR